jgi:hypothetical protein
MASFTNLIHPALQANGTMLTNSYASMIYVHGGKMPNHPLIGFSIPTASLAVDRLRFDDGDGVARALHHGIFYLRHPEQCDFAPGIEFAQNYYLPDEKGINPYRGYHLRELPQTKLGYSDPSDDQVELFQLEAQLWRSSLPSALAELLWQLNRIAKVALHEMFDAVNVAQEHRDRIADGLSRDEALQYCLFNHYRSCRSSTFGFTAHKDSGFITLLHTTEEGLETLEDGIWYDVPPSPGCFTIVLGHAFEVLTANKDVKVNGSYHRVREGANLLENRPDRHSFGVYLGPKFEQDLYQYSKQGELTRHMSFIDFQKQKAAEMGYEFHPFVEA